MTTTSSRAAAARSLALTLAAFGLSACTAREASRPAAGPRYASLDALIDGPARPEPARAATPMAVLPAWIGRPTRLREADRPDAFEQAVSLGAGPRGTSRENLVMLRLVRGDAAEASAGGKPSEAGIRAELAAQFADTPMQVVTRPAANAYGPYGLAVGRTSDGARCLYAWQWIEAAPALDPDARRPEPVSLRLRLCRADVTAEALAAAMNQIRLVPRFAGAPIVMAHRPPATARHVGAASPRTQPARAEPWPGRAEPGRRYLGVAQAARPPAPEAAAEPATGSGLAADLPPEALRGPRRP